MASLNAEKSDLAISTITVTTTSSNDVLFNLGASVTVSSTIDAVIVTPSLAMPPPPVPIAPSTGSVPNSDVVSAISSGGKKSKGRGKIEMKKMEKESNRLVTFSKRKSGLFKKANELCTLCGVRCAVVVFSPAGKVFSFGHPSVDLVVDRYLTGNLNPIAPKQAWNQVPQNLMEGRRRGPNIENLNSELTNLVAALEASKKHSQELDDRREERLASCWWERPVQQMDGGQLDTLKRAMEDLKSKVYHRAGFRWLPSTSSSSPATVPGFNYPCFRGAGPSTRPFSGLPSWNNDHHGPGEAAGPSGNASGVWARRI
uniref:MADS-box domain-containing protein n=1 Tax=Kalanchoe fedtschenkoi TaxID=63787 RepID=A0A7N0TVW8_KALFE